MQSPPQAPKKPRARVHGGETVPDDWFYLRDRDDPDTLRYLEEENRYTEQEMAPAKALEETLYREMVSRILETDTSCPWRMGRYEYYSRTEKARQYPILCRRLPGGAEEVLLDCNALAAGHDYFALAFDHVSPAGGVLAYATNTDGAEVYTLRFRDLTTGNLLPDEAQGVYYSAAWDATGRHFFYTTLDESKRPHRLWRHTLGHSGADTLVFEEPDQRFNVSIERSRSGAWLFLTINSHVTSEVRFAEADRDGAAFRLFAERQQDVEYFIEHQSDWFYMRTNRDARNFRLLRAPVHDFAPDRWEEVIPHREDVALEHVDGFRHHLVTVERDTGLKTLAVRNTDSGETHRVRFDEPAYTFFPERNEEYDTPKFRFVYTSLTTPRSVFDYDMDKRERELKKQQPVPGGYDRADYLSERIFATAPDGKAVPISLVYRKGLQKDGRNPCYLYGYGSYGILTEPAFSSERVSLLDRGFVFAMAHIRGSGDMGRRWYDDGKLMKKRNTFQDFIACSEHLIALGYTSPATLAIAGGSAGGLLVGAVTNSRPDLFRAVIAHVPFVDVVNTMLDPTLPLTVTEYDEWGDPGEQAAYEYIRGYAPYENVRSTAYPHLLVTAGLNDPRVPYWEPAKWVAKLRDRKTDSNRILLKTNMGAGHGGPSGRYEKLREKAFEYAFLLTVLKR